VITLVTGATGFLGRELVAELVRRGATVRAPVREAGGADVLPPGIDAPVAGDLAAMPDFAGLLADVDIVMHLAARAHVTADRGTENSDLYRASNTVLTRRLAAAARAAGVRRFVFVSSIKAFGESDRGRPFGPDDPPQPVDAYGRSKLAAERALLEECAAGGMRPVVVRPPLVYGPGVRANFLRIMRIVERGLPLPFGAIRNRRSMVSRANLVDFLCLCRDAPAAADGTWLVSDGEDLSTPDLIRRLARIMGKPARLFAIPPPLLRGVARLLGFGGEMTRLTESLSMDIGASRERLCWTPPLGVDAGLQRAVDDYLARKRA
jgi:nucleoside-diphosphate-sugar epimerase